MTRQEIVDQVLGMNVPTSVTTEVRPNGAKGEFVLAKKEAALAFIRAAETAA